MLGGARACQLSERWCKGSGGEMPDDGCEVSLRAWIGGVEEAFVVTL